MKRSDSERSRAVVDALRVVTDELRGGRSLRQALIAAGADAASPFSEVAAHLTDGRPIGAALHASASAASDPNVATTLCLLAVHADAGGDPLPACESLAAEVAGRADRRAEARAMTTQARLGARAILMLTPAFLLLVVVSDPGGISRSIAQPRTAFLVGLGLALQGVGSLWISSIVRSVGAPPSRFASVPVLRAVRAMVAGRPKPTTDVEVSDLAQCVTLALDGGLSPTAAIAVVAPFANGDVAFAARAALAELDMPFHEALARAFDHLPGVAAPRFASAVTSSMTLGVPLAPALRAVVADVRTQTSLQLSEDVRRVSIKVLVPLALLVLPAFVLACLVPLFVGGLQQVANP